MQNRRPSKGIIDPAITVFFIRGVQWSKRRNVGETEGDGEICSGAVMRCERGMFILLSYILEVRSCTQQGGVAGASSNHDMDRLDRGVRLNDGVIRYPDSPDSLDCPGSPGCHRD